MMSKEWLRGQDVNEVKRIAKRFASFDDSITHGSMARLGKQSVAAMLADNEIIETSHSVIAVRTVSKQTSIKDFSDKICLVARNFKYVKRIATDDVTACVKFLTEAVGSPAVYELWEEKSELMALAKALGLTYRFSKIRSSSEVIGVYTNFEPESVAQTDATDLLTQVHMNIGTVDVSAAAEEIGTVNQFTDHYSKYNKGEAWSAIALRGYGDESFIAKPAAMTQSWKRANQEKLSWTLHDTSLRAKLPETEKLIQAVPGEKHRIRLMRLAPGGGELERHTDNQDSQIGTRDGELMRIHIPIITNPDVVFTSWDTRGVKNEISMVQGEYWYLDIRKPHRAINGGKSERIHLVMDVEACPALRGNCEARNAR
jgi:Aspartyl/Asparaginyl beta-hydroxylase